MKGQAPLKSDQCLVMSCLKWPNELHQGQVVVESDTEDHVDCVFEVMC